MPAAREADISRVLKAAVAGALTGILLASCAPAAPKPEVAASELSKS
jgi:hypothetical protein